MLIKVLLAIFKKFKYLFYRSPIDVLIFISIFLMMRTMDRCYQIENFSYLSILLLCFLGIAIYHFYKIMMKKETYLIFFVLLCLGTLWVMCHYKLIKPGYIYSTIVDNYIDISLAVSKSEPTLFSQFLPFLVSIIPVAVPVAMILNDKGLGWVEVIAVLVYMLVFWYAGFDSDIKVYFYICIFLASAIYGVNLYKKSINLYNLKKYKVSLKKDSIITQAILLSITVTAMCVIFIGCFGVRNIFQIADQVKAKLLRPVSQNSIAAFDLSQSGFNENSKKLGGPLLLDTNTAFRVKSDECCYLRGSVKDYYDGSVWMKSISELKQLVNEPAIKLTPRFKEYLMGYYEGNGPAPYTESDIRKYLIVYPETLSTSTLFTPNYTYNMKYKGSILSYDDSLSFKTMDGSKVKNPYIVEYYKSITGIELLLEGHTTINEIIGSGKVDDAEMIRGRYKPYLQVPDNIPPEVYKLTDEITVGCSNNFEKILKIKEYLVLNYKYSLDVSEVPAGKEFVSYFLFTEKKGYCTYFATAATILCRIAGIPARYVEGFYMHDKKDKDGLYVVTNDMAHAWTEVLVVPEENLWSIADSVPLEHEEVKQEHAKNIEKSGSRTGIEDYGESPFADIDIEDIYDSYDFVSDRTGEHSAGSTEFYLNTLFWAVACLLVFFVLTVFIVNSRRINNVLGSESIVPFYHFIKRRLRTVDNRSSCGDDYEWLEGTRDFELKQHLQSIIDAAYKEFYGRKGTVAFDRRGSYIYVERYIRNRQNKFIYLFWKYFILTK